MDFPLISYLNAEGELSPECNHQVPPEILVRGYKTMLLTRLVDERMIILQRQGAISFALTCFGEEACSVASAAALDLADWMYPQYREAGVMFWRGFTVKDYLHQMFGTGKDLILGRQMPNHFGSKALNVVPVSSPIGTKIPHAAGCAYAMKIKKEKTISISYFGEGATSEGDFHSGVNFAAVLKAPVIFFCRNNGYAISTPFNKQCACTSIAAKGEGYGISALRIDGNDFFAVHETVAKARELCLAGKGPILIEAVTYRLGAHSTSDDPSLYRKEEECTLWREKDPLTRLRRYLENKNLWNAEKENQALSSIADEITQAIEEAKNTAPPSTHSLIENVYSKTPSYLEKQLQERLEEATCPK